MKKLEALKNLKFKLSEEELKLVKGGYSESGGTYDYSYTTSTTQLNSGGTQFDKTLSDVCRDF